MGASYREYHQANKRYKLPPQPKKPHKSWAGQGKGRGLKGAAPPSTSSEMGGKKGRKGRRGSKGGTSASKMVSV